MTEVHGFKCNGCGLLDLRNGHVGYPMYLRPSEKWVAYEIIDSKGYCEEIRHMCPECSKGFVAR